MSATRSPRPTRSEVAAAAGRTIRDVLAPGLRVVFVGINPGLYSAAVGHHFARPGNRFWKAMHGSGFTDRLLDPTEDAELLGYGLGVTNIVERATASADELSREELRSGARALEAKVEEVSPAFVAMLGLGAYRTAFDLPAAAEGARPERLAGASVWLLPNPSGLNAHHQLPSLIERFAALRAVASGAGGAVSPTGRSGRRRPWNR